MKTLGHFHIDERRSLTELRAILRGLLSEGLSKATKASMAEAMRAAKEAQAAAKAAAAAAAALAEAGGGGDADGEVMDANELEDIRKIMMMKNNKNPSKSRKKRSSHGRGGGAGAHGSSSSTTTTTAASATSTPPPPPPPAGETTVPGTVDAPNGLGSSSANCSAAAGEGGGDKLAASIDREWVKEVKEERADSDDEIPLPEGMPGFQTLEEAMLVRELRKDRLPGKIIRSSDVGGNTAGGLFVGQTISELNLCSSVALVLCLRPRLPQTPLVQEASMSRREKLAEELLENGQANGDNGPAEEEKGPTLEEQKQQLQEAQRQLQALEANLEDMQKKRGVDIRALELGWTTYNKASKNNRSPEQDRSMKAWKKELNARKERIDNTHLKEERPLDKEVKSMKTAVEKMKRSVKKTEKEEDREKAAAQGLESASIFTRVKGVLFSGAKATFGFGRTDDTPDDNAGIAIVAAQLKSNREQESIAMEKEMDKELEASDWGVPKARGNANSSGKKSGGGKGAGKKSVASPSTGQPGSAGAGTGAPEAAGAASASASGGSAAAAAATAMASPETTLADLLRKREDEVERRRTDPVTDLHLWTFWRKNPLGDGGTLPIDEPEWPGPLKEVIVEDVSQPTLDNLHEALGKAYGIPATRVRAIKHNWGKHQWVRLTREMGIKKMKKGKKGKRLVTNLREAPYSFKDGDVVAVVDKMEDESGEADLARADDEAYREHGKGQAKTKKDKKRKKKNKPASKRAVPEVGLTLGGGDWDDGDDDEESDESDESDDLSDMRF